MSTTSAAKRHALGLPAGSVRAILAILIVVLLCALMLIPSSQVRPLPPYLVYLLVLVVVHFFAHHATSRQDSFPLYIPAFLLRLLLAAALIATVAYKLTSDYDGLEAQLKETLKQAENQVFLPLLVLGGFFAGYVFRVIVGRDHPSYFIQDLEAWIALVAVLVMCIAAIIHLVIVPSVDRPISFPTWESLLAVVVAFYFGARS